MSRAAVDILRDPATVRERAHRLLALGGEGQLDHFALDGARLSATADYVANVIRTNYPQLRIPYHGRWRHFCAGGVDRWALIKPLIGDRSKLVRAAIDLAVVSVLLDAGAGSRWQFPDVTSGRKFTRSEGLAVASFEMFRSGIFSSRKDEPFRVDADALAQIDETTLAQELRISSENPMEGLPGRVKLLNNLAGALRSEPEFFSQEGRPGYLYDYLSRDGDRIAATSILGALLVGLRTIWPGREMLEGENLGDVWKHRKLLYDDATAFLMPFHKLSQWLTYSLLEPLEWAGKTVVGLGDLTGLAEYRNGGLFIDTGVLRFRNPEDARRPHAVEDELVVEWRALTVALLDNLRTPVAQQLGLNVDELPLARLLEGGTWAAGRKIAAEKRGSGEPPLEIASDGTVF